MHKALSVQRVVVPNEAENSSRSWCELEIAAQTLRVSQSQLLSLVEAETIRSMPIDEHLVLIDLTEAEALVGKLGLAADSSARAAKRSTRKRTSTNRRPVATAR